MDDAREVDFESRAQSWLAVHPNVATALPDNPVDRSEAEPGAAALFFRGKERLEDAADGFAIHAAAAIRYGQLHIRSGPYVDVLLRKRITQFDVRGFDFQPPAGGHGIAGVGDKIQDDLGQLAAVDFDRPHLPQYHFEMDTLPDDALEQWLKVLERNI